MSTDLREEVRGWLVDARYGLISPAELIARADQMIASLDEPPDFLFALSMGEPLAHISRIDLVKESIVLADLAKLAGRLLKLLESGDIDTERVAIVAQRIAYPYDDEASEEAWREFDWISNEQHFIGTGVKTSSTYEQDVRSALSRAAALTLD